ncbi:MAG: acyltransferase [Pseudomonadota bacterium]
MIRDHRPYYLKKAYRRFEEFYVRHWIRPQLESLGEFFTFVKPWCVEIFGQPIVIGDCVNVIASPDRPVRLSVWSELEGQGRITIGDNCLICPGVRLGSARGISIGDNSMLANGVYVTDSDWHGIYNRIAPGDKAAPVRIEENAWIGDSAIICKGVVIGRNSIVGAGAVVTTDIPANAIAAGNPARVVRDLDPNEKIVTRAEWFKNREKLKKEIEFIEWETLRGNTVPHWLRYLLFPSRGE